jgi:hypothetical protein
VEGFFEQVEPVNFVTIATPHLGSYRLPNTWVDRTFNKMVPLMTSRWAGGAGGLGRCSWLAPL